MSDGGDDREPEPSLGRAARLVAAGLGLVVLGFAAKVVVVAVFLVGGGLLGYQLAGEPGVMAGITVGAVLALGGAYLAVTRSGDDAEFVHDVAVDVMVWVAVGWLVAMGWLVGDLVSGVAAVAGVVLAAVVAGVAGLVVAARLDDGIAPALRRRARRRRDPD